MIFDNLMLTTYYLLLFIATWTFCRHNDHYMVCRFDRLGRQKSGFGGCPVLCTSCKDKHLCTSRLIRLRAFHSKEKKCIRRYYTRMKGDTDLRWYHYTPFLSYVFYQGKCIDCNKPISYVWPLFDLLVLTILLLVVPYPYNVKRL